MLRNVRTRLSPALTVGVLVVALLVLFGHDLRIRAQQVMNANPVTIQTVYSLVPASQTGAANAQVTLTIPAPPPSFYNYVCTLGFNASNNNTAAVITNAVTTSTNFNTFALKFSAVSAASGNYDWFESWGIANVGCPKSTSPGTATTFVSPAAATNWAYTWYGTYYQAP